MWTPLSLSLRGGKLAAELGFKHKTPGHIDN